MEPDLNAPLKPVRGAIRILSWVGGWSGRFVDQGCFKFRHSLWGWVRVVATFLVVIPGTG